MELGVSHVQHLNSLPPVVDNIFDKYNKNLVPIRSLSDHDIAKKENIANASFYNLTKIRNDSRKYKKTHTVLVKLAQNIKI